MLFYYSTTEVGAVIIKNGFRNGISSFGEGIWFTDNPEHMESEWRFSVEIPEGVMKPYLLESAALEGIREWFAPAKVVNRYLQTLKRLL